MTVYTEDNIFYAEVFYARQGIPTANIILRDDATAVVPDDTIQINGVHTTKDSRIYPGAYTFKDEKVGANPTGWSLTEGANYTIQIIKTIGEHNKVVEMYDNDGTNACVMSITITSQTILKIDVWYRTDDITKRAYFSVYDNTPTECQFQVNNITGTANDTWHHLTYIINTTADTYDLYIDGTQEESGTALPTSINAAVKIEFKTHGTDNGYYVYWDAIDGSWDGSHIVGNNIHWEYYTDSMSEANFEGEELYTSSTDINFIDNDNSGVDCTIKIIPSFDYHKKILECYDNNAGARIEIYHILTSQTGTGTVEWYWKSSDVTKYCTFHIRDAGTVGVHLELDEGEFKWYDGAHHVVKTAVNDIWYHHKIIFDIDTDTFDWYIDGVLEADDANFANAVPELDRIYIVTDNGDSGYYNYFDAFGFSWESDYDEGDNSEKITTERTFNTRIFDGRIEDVDMEEAQGIYAISTAQELIQIRPSGVYYGFTDSAIGKVIFDNCNIINMNRTFIEFGLIPNADIIDGNWVDLPNGDGDGDLYDEVDEVPGMVPGATDIRSATADDTAEIALSDYPDFDPTKNYAVHRARMRYTYDVTGGNGLYIALYDGIEWKSSDYEGSGFGMSTTWWKNIYRTHEEIPNFKFRLVTGSSAGTVIVGEVRVMEQFSTGDGVQCYHYENDGRIENGDVKVIIGTDGESAIIDILNLCALSDLKTWYLGMDNGIYFNGGNHASGISLSSTSNLGNIHGTRKIKSYDKVILYGGFVGGSQITATSGVGNIIAKDTYSEITNQSILNSLASQLLTEKGANIYDITLLLSDSTIGVPQVGETISIGAGVKFSNSSKTILAGDYIIDEIKYVGSEGGEYNYIELKLIDILIFSLTEEQKLAIVEKMTKQNSNLITQV